MRRTLKRTITITSSETWTVSLESDQPIADQRSHSSADVAHLPSGPSLNPANREQLEAEQSRMPAPLDDIQSPTTPAIECNPIIKIEPPTKS